MESTRHYHTTIYLFYILLMQCLLLGCQNQQKLCSITWDAKVWGDGKLSFALDFWYTISMDALNTLTGKKKTNIHDATLDVTTNGLDANLIQFIASENCKNDHINWKIYTWI